MSLKKAVGIIVLVLLIDQISKIYIKTHFALNDEYVIASWFKILFVENEGMAWGTVIPGAYGKIILTLFRIIILPLIGYWLNDAVQKNASKILIVAVALIFAGAFGNIIDSIFYGLLFDSSAGQIASFMPESGGYGTFLHGKVVDMLYFPIWKGYLPEWLPIWGGDYFTFFNAVFNIADTAISTGVGLLLVFNKRAFANSED
ncbi:lipoprotein signal peptidase [Flavimarina sp. Hel_I_48]|uniref:lipoprotein signal peptidase n=1 Tax=Flavimarina sp. Hel_I_48 TaxID=1392488 RepID=UPI0004DF4DA5|nr:lipoprotein signal peptidase [Flavimarina sp. Hel_I_48]